MNKKENFVENQFTWPLSKKLLFLIIDDRVSDVFVCEMIWERLFYNYEPSIDKWISGPLTSPYWSERFINAPQIISERPASVHLTRSIPKEYKQSLKNYLNFKGYKFTKLYPRRTRRATAVNWLIYWAIDSKYNITEDGILPDASSPPSNPIKGHQGDPDIR